MKNVKLFEEFIIEKKPKGAPDFHHSDAPDAEGRFKDLSINSIRILKYSHVKMSQTIIIRKEQELPGLIMVTNGKFHL